MSGDAFVALAVAVAVAMAVVVFRDDLFSSRSTTGRALTVLGLVAAGGAGVLSAAGELEWAAVSLGAALVAYALARRVERVSQR